MRMLTDVVCRTPEQISGIKVYRQEERTSDEILVECDFMWAGQQVRSSTPACCCEPS